MSHADLIERLGDLDPARTDIDAAPTWITHSAERVLHAALNRERSRELRTRSLRRPRAVAGMAVALAAGALGLMNVSSTPSAAATVRSALTAANQSTTGRARMTVEGRIGDQASTGVIEMEWNGHDEAYRMSEGGTVTGEFRYVDGVRYQRDRNRPAWRVAGEDSNNQLVQTTNGDRLAEMNPRTRFTRHGSDVINGERLAHFVAAGDLQALDTNRSGFIFGVNGSAGVHTTSLEVWLDETQTIRRVQMSFSGTSDGVLVDASTTTDISDLDAAITIDRPAPLA